VTVKAFRGIPVRGIFLAALRDELLFTQEELAPKIGMTKGSLSRLETSEMEGMNRESFRRLAELAGLSYEALRQRISVPPSPAQALQQIEATARQAGLTAEQVIAHFKRLPGSPKRPLVCRVKSQQDKEVREVEIPANGR
jgi:transcriptional regulator with XRE-family HTH domain